MIQSIIRDKDSCLKSSLHKFWYFQKGTHFRAILLEFNYLVIPIVIVSICILIISTLIITHRFRIISIVILIKLRLITILRNSTHLFPLLIINLWSKITGKSYLLMTRAWISLLLYFTWRIKSISFMNDTTRTFLWENSFSRKVSISGMISDM